MARNESKRLSPSILQADQNAYTALQVIEGYAPANPEFALTNVTEFFNDFISARQAEVNAQNALDAARDAATAAEWGLHNSMLGVKAQVIAQFGDDSDEVQALGLTKKSERKPPTRKTTATA